MNNISYYDIPNYPQFKIDKQYNIYIIDESERICKIIPYNTISFEWNGHIYHPFELMSISFYGVVNKDEYTSYSKINDTDILVNDTVFRKIPDFLDGYYISNFGAVFSTYRNNLRKCEIDRDGYHRISFPYPNLTHIAIHRLVYKTWIGVIPNGYVIDHKDNNKWNNCYTNLSAVTAFENSRKAAQDGLYAKTFYWNEDNVYQVCEMMKNNVSVKDIAAAYDITPDDKKAYKNFRNQLYSFRNHGKGWKDITSKYNFDGYDGFMRSDSKFRDNEIRTMRELYSQGKSIREIAVLLNTDYNDYFRKLVMGQKRKKLKI